MYEVKKEPATPCGVLAGCDMLGMHIYIYTYRNCTYIYKYASIDVRQPVPSVGGFVHPQSRYGAIVYLLS